MATSDEVRAGMELKAYKPTLVLLHGWGYDNTCWPEVMLQQLRTNYDLMLLDLPGHGQDHYVEDNRNSLEQLDEWITSSKQLLPSQYHLMGWSLGAQIAIRMAHNDCCIQRLILMAVNPKFMRSDEWSAAMSPELLAKFEQGYETQTSKTLRRFASLQAQGSANSKFLTAQMIQLMLIQPEKIFGLKLLQQLDERAHLCQLSQPCFIELAQADELVPSDWVNHLLLPNNVQIHTVAGGHGYLFEPNGINKTMAKFIDVGLGNNA
jgi:pimeloyl-[acyl-carrier protein] methyl ester esterase